MQNERPKEIRERLGYMLKSELQSCVYELTTEVERLTTENERLRSELDLTSAEAQWLRHDLNGGYPKPDFRPGLP